MLSCQKKNDAIMGYLDGGEYSGGQPAYFSSDHATNDHPTNRDFNASQTGTTLEAVANALESFLVALKRVGPEGAEFFKGLPANVDKIVKAAAQMVTLS